jgi:DNA polymerase (family 10)
MPVHNADIARVFADIADLLELSEANLFRVRAYRNAARTVGDLRLDLAAAIVAGKAYPKLPGIGADLDAKIHEIVATGTCALLEKLQRQLPPAITELLKIPGLGPKRVKALHESLDIDTLPQLLEAARKGKIRDVPGFGAKTEAHIVEAVQARLGQARRFKLAVAAQYALPLAAYLKGARGAREVVIAGSYRRMKETVGDIDILVTAAAGVPVMERFVKYPEVREVLAKGDTRASVVLKCGLQVDLRAVPPESFGAALHYFTGSKAHNIAIRRLAQERGLKLNEYGVFKGEKRVACETEESVFASVDLPWIPPELREDRGEIEAARRGELPRLVELGDLRGDLHLHTKASDGRSSLREMALAAKARGLDYIAVTEHSQRETQAHGLDSVRLAKQLDEIDRLNAELKGIAILKGIEVDILEDGSLDLPDSVLAKLDVVVAAVHARFNLPGVRQTARVLKALDNPYVSILAHPSGRLIDEREPCEIDMQAVIRRAKARGVALELNAHPDRLDLDDTAARMAKEEGALVAINSDAHSVHDFENLAFGVGQARRGWLEAGDVLNSRPLAEVLELVGRRSAAVAPPCARGRKR